MPHAKIDTAFLRDHFAAIPENARPGAVALYLQLVVTSAELLLDGVIPRVVVEAGGAEIGISRGRYARREIARTCSSLREARLVEIARNGTVTLLYWQDHHSSRGYVDERRKADAERKRKGRGQLTIGDVTQGFHSGRPHDVRSGVRSGVRSLARGTESESERSTSSSDVPVDAAATPDDDLRLRLEHLGVNGRALTNALAEPDRANAWIDYTHAHANGNAAGYFATSFAGGDWPPSARSAPNEPDIEERAHALYVRTGDSEQVADWLAGLTRLSIDQREHILAAVTATIDDDEPDLATS